MNWLTAALLAGQDAEPAAAEAAEPALRIGWTIAAAAVAVLLWYLRPRWSPAAKAVLSAAAVLLALYGLPTPVQPSLDRGLQAAWDKFGGALGEPLLWGVLLGGAGMLLMLPRGDHRRRLQGAVAAIVSLGFFAASAPPLAGVAPQAVFWVLAAVTLISAVATITMTSAVYSAIWFALSLLGTAGLFFYQGSQFLGVATIVVYAGAIVVTFLFVVMLAQPDGHATYDRLTWGSLPKPLSVLAAALLLGSLAFAVSGAGAARQQVLDAAAAVTDADGLPLLSEERVASVARRSGAVVVAVRGELEGPQLQAVRRALAAAVEAPVIVETLDPRRDVLAKSHMARLGAELFTRHLLSVELAGTLLLAALVGAIAIIIAGKDLAPAEETI